MDFRHFFKMLLGLILMAAIGLGGLAFVNYYAKQNEEAPVQVEAQPVQADFKQRPIAPPGVGR